MSHPDVEDIQPLSPLQHGMLFQSESSPGQDGYLVQMTCRLDGPLDVDLLRRAWQDVVGRHPVLRTSVHWRGLRTPVQVVHREVVVPFVMEETAGDQDEAEDQEWSRLCEQDRSRGLTFAQAPLLRVTVLRVGPDSHRLLWTHHHLILDGWSIAIVLREVLASYRARVDGVQPWFDEAPAFSEYLRWLGEYDSDVAQVYWRDRLAGWSGAAPLGGDLGPTSSTAAAGSGEVARRDVGPTVAAVQRWAAQHHKTAGAVYHLAWALTVSGFSGDLDAVFGTTVSLRAGTVPAAGAMLGPVINTVPVRLRVAPEQSVRTCLDSLTEQLVADGPMHHLDLTRIRVVSEVAADQEFFATSLAVENYPADRDVSDALDGVVISDVRWRNSAGAPIAVVVVPDEGVVSLTFDRHRFEPWTATAMLEHFLATLDAVVRAHPDDALGEVVVPAGHVGAPVTQVSGPLLPAHLMFAERVAAAPGAPAVSHGDIRLSYGEVDRRAAGLARTLAARGVGRGSHVALVMDLSLDFLVGVLAVLRRGAAYVPINPADPIARQREVHRIAAPEWTLVGPAVDPAEWPGSGVLPLNGTGSSAASETSEPPADVGAFDTAYVLFTSGSSGRPKGVVTGHRALSSYLRWATDTYQTGPGTVTPAHSSPSFDLSVTSLLGPLVAGGEVRILSRHDVDGGLADHLRSDAAPGTIKLTPAHLTSMRSTRPRGRTDAFVLGGESLSGPQVQEWLQDNPGADFYNEYGPTEATVGCVVHRVDNRDRDAPAVPIGTPVPGTGIRVLDDDLRPVPDGAVGELFLTGLGLANGYLQAPAATAHSFLPLPDADEPGARMYRTGDLVRWGPRGLVYLGRRDGQVKVRGHRVELAEIEAKLAAVEGVHSAAVALDADHGLKAFVVRVPDRRPEAAELATALERVLPQHMVPARYAFLDRLPKSSSGKLDRTRLEVLDADLAVRSGTQVRPDTATEEALAELWARTLGRDKVGVEDDFFRLGGDSLTAMRMVAQATAALASRFTAGDVLGCRSIRLLAAQIDQTPPRGQEQAPAVDDLTAAQLRFYLLHELDPALYNTASAVVLRGKLDTDHLEWAVRSVVARHDVLRSSFVPTPDGTPTVRVTPDCSVQVGYADLRAVSRHGRAAAAREAAAKLAAQPFDLAVAPLLRIELLTTDTDEYVLVLVLHHIVSDARSQAVLVEDLCAAYMSGPRGGSAPMSAAQQFAAVVDHEPQDPDGDLAFWRSRLAEPLPELLLTDAPRPDSAPSGPAAEIRTAIEEDLWREVEEVSRQVGVSVFSTLSAALRLLLTRFHHAVGDVAIGTPVSMREHASSDRVIGPAINTVVLRDRVDLDEPASGMLLAEQQTVTAALRHRAVPFEHLVREFARPDHGGRSPLFDVLFDFQRITMPDLRLAGLSVAEFDLGPPPARFDLQLDVWESGGRAAVRWSYRADLFEESSLRALAEAHLAVLRRLVRSPDGDVGDIPLSDHGAPAPANSVGALREDGRRRLVADLVAEQAGHVPEAVAVRASGRDLSYQDLEDAVRTRAGHLVDRGVGPEVAVGVLMDRSADLVVTVLAILRAGGTYLPLDPDFPNERLRYVVDDADPLLVLSDGAARGRATALGAPVLCVDDGVPESAASLSLPTPVGTNAAYVIYTSGSTGRPKGVVVSHAALTNRVLWAQEEFGLTDADRVLHKTPVGFDVSVWELLWPLVAGATMVVAAPGVQRDPDRLTELLRRERVSVVHFVPSMLRAVVDSGHLGDCSSLTQIICSGETLSAGLHDDAAAVMGARVHNLYGPTEATIDVTSWTRDNGPTPHRVPIGLPVANTSVQVLDGRMHRQPSHAIGEICVGGVQVGRGYVGRPALTADAFRPDPDGVPGGRLYRTGDVGRVRDHGVVEFLGRVDDQVKIRGQRIEVGEVESVLSHHPAVIECAVRVVDIGSGAVLQGCYVSAGLIDEDELASHLARSVTAAMVPSVWSQIDSVPRQASGKIDRAALPEPGLRTAASGRPPEPGDEQLLAQAWSAVLPTTLPVTVGPRREDSFFSAGGDSILVLRLIARAADLGLGLTVTDVFKAPTLAGMAARVTPLATGPAGRRSIEPFALLGPENRIRVPDTAVDAYPMTALQTGMVLHSLLQPDTRLYKNLDSVLLRNRFDRDALSAAVSAVVTRHPVLRTTFDLEGPGGPLQIVHADVRCEVQVTDLRGVEEQAARSAFDTWVEEQVRVEWDLDVAPLIGFHVHRFDDNTFRLSLPHHHAILDGWSLGLLAAELVSTYGRLTAGQDVESVSLPNNGFRLHVAEELTARDDDTSRTFWTRMLAGSTEEPLLGPLLRSEAPVHVVRLQLTSSQTFAVRDWATARDVPLKSVLFAVHCAVLSAASGRSDFVTGMTLHGRTADNEGLSALGLFLNSVPVPVRTANESWEGLVRRSFDLERSILPHRHVPSQSIRRGRGRGAPFDTLFNFTHFHVLADVLDDSLASFLYDVVEQESHSTSSIPLVANLDLAPGRENLSVELAADRSVLTEADLNDLVGLYRRGIANLVAAPASSARLLGPPVAGFTVPT